MTKITSTATAISACPPTFDALASLLSHSVYGTDGGSMMVSEKDTRPAMAAYKPIRTTNMSTIMKISGMIFSKCKRQESTRPWAGRDLDQYL